MSGAWRMFTGGVEIGIAFSGGVAFVFQGGSEGDIRRALECYAGD